MRMGVTLHHLGDRKAHLTLESLKLSLAHKLLGELQLAVHPPDAALVDSLKLFTELVKRGFGLAVGSHRGLNSFVGFLACSLSLLSSSSRVSTSLFSVLASSLSFFGSLLKGCTSSLSASPCERGKLCDLLLAAESSFHVDACLAHAHGLRGTKLMEFTRGFTTLYDTNRGTLALAFEVHQSVFMCLFHGLEVGHCGSHLLFFGALLVLCSLGLSFRLDEDFFRIACSSLCLDSTSFFCNGVFLLFASVAFRFESFGRKPLALGELGASLIHEGLDLVHLLGHLGATLRFNTVLANHDAPVSLELVHAEFEKRHVLVKVHVNFSHDFTHFYHSERLLELLQQPVCKHLVKLFTFLPVGIEFHAHAKVVPHNFRVIHAICKSGLFGRRVCPECVQEPDRLLLVCALPDLLELAQVQPLAAAQALANPLHYARHLATLHHNTRCRFSPSPYAF
mmetsp:Transcript_5651/g.10139  ORF Transcript_5651/g.10139 Transcript_5651/m.10139 type:complete len:451 (+) Transcript_5651:108-1460(+)